MIRHSFNTDLMEDPFFAAHRNHMMSMGSMFPMPHPFLQVQPQIADARIVERDQRNRRHQNFQRQLQPVSPFNMMSIGFGGMLSNMDKMMSDMHNRFEQPVSSPIGNGQNFVQSSYVSYSNVGNGAPRVYQSSVSQRSRGGAVEIKKTEKDSSTGVEKIVIGHKIGEREHKIEKEKNNKTGENVVNQEYVNLEEEEAESFDREFQHKVSQTMPLRGTDHSRRHRVTPTDNHSHSHPHSHNYRPPRQILPPRHRSYHDRN